MTSTTSAPSSVLTLDEAQTRVVEHGSGPMLALGGPGTGKTTVLVERFLRLAASDGCSPDRILFLVANRAQKIELQNALTERLLMAEGTAVVEVPVYTWHGLANHLVGRHYKKLGYPEPPVLLTSPEQWGDIRDALRAENPVNWPNYKGLLSSPGFADEVVDFCIRAGQRALSDAELRRLVELKPEFGEIVAFYRKQLNRLRSSARIDYPTLLSEATSLIADYDDVRDSLRTRFTHVLVDDGQELSLVQQRMLRFLTGFADGDADPGGSLVVAADPDSAIEAFRGADPGWLEHAANELGVIETVVLSTSYRLGKGLGTLATAFVARTGEAEHRPGAFRGETTVHVKAYASLAAEVDAISRALRRAHLDDKVPYEDMAVLLTSPAAMLPPLERALDAVEVPYQVAVPDRPLEHEPSVRAFRSLARYAIFDEDDALGDLLRSPLAGLEDRQIRELERAARLAGVTLMELFSVPVGDLEPEVAPLVEPIKSLANLVRTYGGARADQAFWEVWAKAPYYRTLEEKATKEPASARELEALAAFARALGRFVERRRGRATLEEYLEAIGRADFGSDPWLPPERRRGGVQVLSFHSAKGRQWSVVGVCGCIEGAIPKGRRARGLFDPYFLDEDSSVERARKNEAEDRRVFYVAITRASKHCIISTSPGPSRRGAPSRFLEELTGVVPETEQVETAAPLTLAEAAGRFRKVLSDVTAPNKERVAALIAVAHACAVDPSCSSAHPNEWWWRWDWTEGDVAIREQSRRPNDELPADKMMTSYSRISNYDNCGLQYLFSVVLGLDPDSSHNMAFGTWIHQIFEDCERHEPNEAQVVQGRIRLTNRDMVMARYEELFDESVFPNKVIARQFKRDGYVILDRYINHLDPGGALVVEHSFEVDLDGHKIRGRIDRVDAKPGGLVIKDYKTSRNPIYYDDARESLQLGIYYLAATTEEEISKHGKPIAMQLVYPAHFARGQVSVRGQTPDEAQAALDRLPALIEGALVEDFRPNPEANCRWCKFKPLCPLWPEGKELSG
ncbi:MAG: AAA family ATPase [Actinobacteria bacterium]|nr:AAA family ATPase [Actinomycetota bacterium]